MVSIVGCSRNYARELNKNNLKAGRFAKYRICIKSNRIKFKLYNLFIIKDEKGIISLCRGTLN